MTIPREVHWLAAVNANTAVLEKLAREIQRLAREIENLIEHLTKETNA